MKKESKKVGAYEIAPGMTSEEILSIFFDEKALKEQPERVFRLDSSGHRYYYTFNEKGEAQFFVSVTTLIKQTTPTSPHLVKWIAEMGYEEAGEFTQERADYGTFMHAEIAKLLIEREVDLDGMKERLRDFITDNELPVGFMVHFDELKKDVAAFAQFAVDCNVRPLAIEIVLTHPRDGYAGALDLPCVMEIEQKGYWGEVYKSGAQKGKPKETKKKIEVVALVDFKSGRKGFYEDHEIQLAAYREMWNVHYPDLRIERMFNWSPKDWRGKVPTYNLKDQTESPNIEKLKHLVEIARIEDGKRSKNIMVVSGKISLDNPVTIAESIQEMELSELVKKKGRYKDETTPETAKLDEGREEE